MKKNQKLKNKFLDFFYILHVVRKQANKLDLSIKWKIYDVFYVSLPK